MRVRSQLFDCIHLDPGYALLSVQNCITCLEVFRMLDVHNNASINDVQFERFLGSLTDLTQKQADTLFELLDVDHSGELEFEEFYLVFCIMISAKDQYEKEFIYRHSMNVFRLIDADQSGLISGPEFKQMGVLFSFDYNSILSIFNEFDVSGDKNLDFMEFRLFTMACIDEQRSADAMVRVKVLSAYHARLLKSLDFLIRMYMITQKLPQAADVNDVLKGLPDPFIPEVKRRFSYFDCAFLESKFSYNFCLPFRQGKALREFFLKLIRFLCCCFCCCKLARKTKSLVKDEEGWRCCRRMQRRKYEKKIRTAHLPTNVYRVITQQKKIRREAEKMGRRKSDPTEVAKRKSKKSGKKLARARRILHALHISKEQPMLLEAEKKNVN